MKKSHIYDENYLIAVLQVKLQEAVAGIIKKPENGRIFARFLTF